MSSPHVWIALFLLSVMTSDIAVYGRLMSLRTTQEEANKPTLGTDVLKRWRREITETHLERCAQLSAPWLDHAHAPQDDATPIHLRIRPFSPGVSHGLVFPGKSLFNFVRRVYHCCQQRINCRSVKGIQGHTGVEFLLSRDISLLTIVSAELHLQLSNPQHVNIRPVLPSLAKRNLPTRYSSWTRGNTLELRVDLQFLFKSLQEAAGGATSWGPSLVNMRRVALSPRGAPLREKPHALQDTDGDVAGDGMHNVLELGLVLDCSQAGSGVSCRSSGVHLSHTPFIALYYK
uniref:Uncharacterized protein n=1 Tax=Sphaeramia orbicularis TaxID=375764 RepID=A0A673CJ89_9TELE